MTGIYPIRNNRYSPQYDSKSSESILDSLKNQLQKAVMDKDSFSLANACRYLLSEASQSRESLGNELRYINQLVKDRPKDHVYGALKNVITQFFNAKASNHKDLKYTCSSALFPRTASISEKVVAKVIKDASVPATSADVSAMFVSVGDQKDIPELLNQRKTATLWRQELMDARIKSDDEKEEAILNVVSEMRGKLLAAEEASEAGMFNVNKQSLLFLGGATAHAFEVRFIFEAGKPYVMFHDFLQTEDTPQGLYALDEDASLDQLLRILSAMVVDAGTEGIADQYQVLKNELDTLQVDRVTPKSLSVLNRERFNQINVHGPYCIIKAKQQSDRAYIALQVAQDNPDWAEDDIMKVASYLHRLRKHYQEAELLKQFRYEIRDSLYHAFAYRVERNAEKVNQQERQLGSAYSNYAISVFSSADLAA